jgi:hypothetical protein
MKEYLSTFDKENIKHMSNKPNYSFRGSDIRLPSVKDSEYCAFLKEPTMYTGDKMIGIATMHKSNAVPVFSSEDAAAIANMRR